MSLTSQLQEAACFPWLMAPPSSKPKASHLLSSLLFPSLFLWFLFKPASYHFPYLSASCCHILEGL